MCLVVRKGWNRWVILTRRHAVKFPHAASWRRLLYGLLNNMNERESARRARQGACPVVFAMPGGLVNVMPRCRELTQAEFEALDVDCFKRASGIEVEAKRDSFGWLGGELVAVDYGIPRELRW